MGTRVYIGRLPYRCQERDVERFFRGYGQVREVMLKNGYGFVEFDDPRDADDAVYELNGKELLGERVLLEHARGPIRRGGGGGDYGRSSRSSRPVWVEKYGVPTRTDYRLIVENLSSRVSWQDLKDYMRQAGDVTYADAHKGRRNEGVVEFATRSDMQRAIDKLDDTDINGRRIRLIEDNPSHGRSRSRSRSRSYSRSRSSSRSKSRSKSRSRDRSRDKSRDRSRDRSRDKSRDRSRSRSAEKDEDDKEEKKEHSSDREDDSDN